MRTLFLSLVFLSGWAFSQSVVTYGGNYTTASGQQRSINLIPTGNGQFKLVDASADGLDQHELTVNTPAGSESVTATLPSGEIRMTVSGNSFQVMVRPDMPPVVLTRHESNP